MIFKTFYLTLAISLKEEIRSPIDYFMFNYYFLIGYTIWWTQHL